MCAHAHYCPEHAVLFLPLHFNLSSTITTPLSVPVQVPPAVLILSAQMVTEGKAIADVTSHNKCAGITAYLF